jgi:prepilin-type N-terminal cleavage/methylation domain-containing protein
MMRRGFSLIELSIVLVILGLLTGGILAGKALIRASELRAVSTEHARWLTAVSAFRDKYFAIPGDMANATSFWGDQATGTGACPDAAVTDGSPGTCNGNGNGTISVPGGALSSGESFRFWQHLALAGLIEGAYTGISDADGSIDVLIGMNVPASKMSGGGWSLRYIAGTYAGDAASYGATNYGNFFEFGRGFASGTNGGTYGAIMTPAEQWNVDTKLDDGLPGLGKMIATSWNNSCATGGASETDLANSVYKLAYAGTVCAARFVRAF